MRMHERTLVVVQIAPRIRHTGALGGRRAAFSEDAVSVRGCVLPETGSLERHERGLDMKKRLRVLVPADVKVCPGDRLTHDGEDYLVTDVSRWVGHAEVACEAML